MSKYLHLEDKLERLKNIIHPFVQLTDEEWVMILDRVQVLYLKKGEFYIREGQACNQVGFLFEGILRVYYMVDEKEFTSYFNFYNRNPLVSSFESFLLQKPSTESIHTLEDSILITLTRSHLNSLYEMSASFQKLGRLMAEQNYILAIERIRSLQFQSANDRYEQLLTIYPQLINKIPHHYIASYLGITPESLSRIRKSRE